jgi:hypothetical protein
MFIYLLSTFKLIITKGDLVLNFKNDPPEVTGFASEYDQALVSLVTSQDNSCLPRIGKKTPRTVGVVKGVWQASFMCHLKYANYLHEKLKRTGI